MCAEQLGEENSLAACFRFRTQVTTFQGCCININITFRHRQLDVIEPALENLDKDQQLIGAQLLLDYLSNVVISVQEEDYINRLLQIGSDFILLTIIIMDM